MICSRLAARPGLPRAAPVTKEVKEAETASPDMIKGVKTVPIRRFKNQKWKDDPYYPAAVERAKEAVRRLQEAGIIVANGWRIRQDLPPDMQESPDRDFGG